MSDASERNSPSRARRAGAGSVCRRKPQHEVLDEEVELPGQLRDVESQAETARRRSRRGGVPRAESPRRFPPLRGNAPCARRPAEWRLRPRASCRRGLRGRRFPVPHPRRESSAPAPEGRRNSSATRISGRVSGSMRPSWTTRTRDGAPGGTMRTNRRSEASPASRTSEVDEGMPARRSQLRARDSGVSGCCACSVIAPTPASRREGRPPRCRWQVGVPPRRRRRPAHRFCGEASCRREG